MTAVILRGRWVFPGCTAPISQGCVTIGGERIVAAGPAPKGQATIDLGNVAILPGLVSAHTHLELSDCRSPLGRPGVGMAEWIRLVMRWRQGRSAGQSLRRGLAELIRYGTTAVADIVQAGTPITLLQSWPLGGLALMELLAPTAARVPPAIETAENFLHNSAGESWRVGLSPHAPYTVHPQLLRAAVAISIEHGTALAFHLAESREELQLLQNGSGPLRELLEEREAWTPELVQPGTRPLHYLQMLASAPRALVIHGNYLDEEEIAFLAARRDTLAVVYCPRTHAWFRHDADPLSQLLAAGCTVALGSDSRASSPDLSLLAEMQAAAVAHPEIAPAQFISVATAGGARALGMEGEMGTLEPGKLANLTVVALPESAGDPYESLLSPGARVVGRWWRGREDG